MENSALDLGSGEVLLSLASVILRSSAANEMEGLAESQLDVGQLRAINSVLGIKVSKKY